MGFGKYKNANSADLLHKVELYDFATGDPAVINGKRQFFVVRGAKSRQWQSAIEREAAKAKRKGKGAEDFSFAENAKVLARRLSEIVVAAYVDVGDDEPDIIEFDNIDLLPANERNQALSKLRETFTDITDLTMFVHDEVVKDVNFLPGHGQALSALLSKEPGTAPSPATVSEVA